MAYALILLRENGVPALFYPDLYGANYQDRGDDGEDYQIDMPVIPALESLVRARQQFAHGVQTDWFDDANCIAFSRSGTETLSGCVVIMSNGEEGEKRLELGEHFATKSWYDYLGHRDDVIESDEYGTATFRCHPGSVSVWVIAT